MPEEIKSKDPDAPTPASEVKPKSVAPKVKRGKPPREKQTTKQPVASRKVAAKIDSQNKALVEPTTSFIKGLKGKRKIVGLTAYDAILGAAVSAANVDFILVGDSLGTTLLGHETTISVTLEDMIRHTAAVRRSNPRCLLVADLPFGEASFSFDRLLESSRRLMQEGGADAIKIEGGRDVADDIEKLVATGIPVLGHIGLLPQTVKAIGGYRKFGETREEAENIYTDAITLEEAGCFAIVGEMLHEQVATELAKQILPPLIGIGSGTGCDGQILVTTDLLGWSNGFVPKFVKPYANLNKIIADSLDKYVRDIRTN
jgi:3-methyl-2-oxobutanoate hydroxymethyltransferase